MPFKIIQTKERGNILLSVVPDCWELDGIVKWPQSGKIKISTFIAMQRDENSLPGIDWVDVKCRLKRQCATYEEAVKQSKEMSDQSDTEASDAMPPPVVLPPKRKMVDRKTIGRAPVTDFGDLVSNFFDFLRNYYLWSFD